MTVDRLDRAKLEALFDEFYSDPAVQRGLQEMAQAQQKSHLQQGDSYCHEGKLRKAIDEYRKDTGLEITTYALAATVQRAFCHMGDTFKLLGELDHAIAAYTQALQVWREIGYGEKPHASLAAAYLEQGQVDEAIQVCQQDPEEAEDPCVQQVLAEARRLKSGGAPSEEPVPGCRRIELPYHVVSTPSRQGGSNRRDPAGP